MNKELTDIAPTNLDGSEAEPVVTIKTAPSAEEAEAAAAAEKEKNQEYYVDPLEQDSLMKEKLEKIEFEKERKKKETYGEDEEEKEEEKPAIDPSIRPDMNVTGYFSAGNTAKKQSFVMQPASKHALTFGVIFGVIDAIYSAFFTIILISSNFDIKWYFGWAYALVVIFSIIIVINGIRSLKAQKDTIKQKALVGIVGSAISIVPLIAIFINWIINLF